MAQPNPHEPVVVEPVVNREKLRELLALQTEYAALDFKSACDLAVKRDEVELAKDVGAMSVRGGFLVIGVDRHGNPTGKLTSQQATVFDESALRSRMLKWLPDSLEICSQTHGIDGLQVALVFVAPNPAGCAFFRADGQYLNPGDKITTVVFREGEVFFRDGTKSTRLNQSGLELVIRRRVDLERARWENEHAASYRRLADQLRSGTAGQLVARGPAVEFNLALEPDVLTEAAIELLRVNDDIPLRRLRGQAVRDARELFSATDLAGLGGLLDRLTCLAATFLELARVEWFEQVIDIMVLIYGLGFENEPPVVNAPSRRAGGLWLDIVDRVVALGALAVRRSDWPAVRCLASRRPPDVQHYPTWLRHAMVMAARAELLTRRDGGHEVLDSLLSHARDTVRRLDCLRPDVEPEDEKILTGLTQFDFLACLVTMADSDNRESLIPQFARFYASRTQPIAQRLLRDPRMRTTLYPGDDHHLAVALAAIDRDAQRAGVRYDGWSGYTSEVNAFISEHEASTGQR